MYIDNKQIFNIIQFVEYLFVFLQLNFETMMQRLILDDLLSWKDDPQRKPLILLGARQVGKTFILKEFGRSAFNNLVYVNCHNNPFAENLFTDFNIERILYQIEQACGNRLTSNSASVEQHPDAVEQGK